VTVVAELQSETKRLQAIHACIAHDINTAVAESCICSSNCSSLTVAFAALLPHCLHQHCSSCYLAALHDMICATRCKASQWQHERVHVCLLLDPDDTGGGYSCLMTCSATKCYNAPQIFEWSPERHLSPQGALNPAAPWTVTANPRLIKLATA
jgi:hypothetical protein